MARGESHRWKASVRHDNDDNCDGMIGSLKTLATGIGVAVLVLVVAVLAAIGIIGLATKAALFGEPRITLAVKVFERVLQGLKTESTDITRITSNQGEEK